MNAMKLKIKQFIKIEKAEIVFDKPLTVIHGENATGKTTIKDAMDYVLGADKIRGLAKADYGELGRNGERFAVEFTLPNGTVLKGTKSKKPKIETIAEEIGVSRRAISFCTNPSLFLTAGAAKLKQLFSEVLRLNVDWRADLVNQGCRSDLVSRLPDDLKKAQAAAEEIRAGLGGDLKDGVGKGANRAKLVVPDPPENVELTTPDGKVCASEIDIDEVEAAMRKLRNDSLNMITLKKEIEAVDPKKRKADMTRLKDLESKLDDIVRLKRLATELENTKIQFLELEAKSADVSRLAELEAELKMLPDVEKSKQALREIENERHKLEESKTKIEARYAANEKIKQEYTEFLEDLCEVCRPKAERKILMKAGAVEGNEESIDKIRENIARLSKKMLTLQSEIGKADNPELRSKITELKRSVGIGLSEGSADDLAKKIGETEKSIASIDIEIPNESVREINKMLIDSEMEIEKLERSVGAAVPEGSAEEIDKKIGDIEARIESGVTMRDTVRDYQVKVADYKIAIGKLDGEREEWDAWNKVCHALPEVEAAAIAEGLTPLRKIIADQKILPGDIEISDDLDISYDGRPFGMASRAEQFLIALAPFFATTELFKFPFCVIDNVDVIVSEDLSEALLEILTKMSEQKPTIVFESRRADDTEEMAKDLDLPHVGLYQTGGGTVRRLV